MLPYLCHICFDYISVFSYFPGLEKASSGLVLQTFLWLVVTPVLKAATS